MQPELSFALQGERSEAYGKNLVLCPADQAQYLYFLNEVSPKLDDAGISFSLMRPSQDIFQLILKDTGRDGT